MSDDNYYKVGGSLEYQHPTYVVRQADFDLYEGLYNGEFCCVLNSRQMGKSSLRVQMMKKLKEQGVKCASIDMTRIGSHVTLPEWYAGVVSELLRGFSLSKKVDFSFWWRQRELLPPLQRLRELIEDVLLAEFTEKLVIFIDEIDSIIKIKFKEDFFAFIRACYNQRVDNPGYNRLTFCLLGVATPSDLIEDKNISTPFNIGRAIELTGFGWDEAQPLAQGLEGRVSRAEVVLREVLEWTGGQPFLTQKLCKLILTWDQSIAEGREAEGVEELVRSRLIENWETQDEPEHLRTIRDRILQSGQHPSRLLGLYQHILQQGEVAADDSPEQMELRLSGLLVRQQGKLRIYNRIYASIFNQDWVDKVSANLRPYSEAFAAWLASNCQDKSRLLRGRALQEAQTWANGKNLSAQDYQFLTVSQESEIREVKTALEVVQIAFAAEIKANQVLTEAQHKAEQAWEEEKQTPQRLVGIQQNIQRTPRKIVAELVLISVVLTMVVLWTSTTIRAAQQTNSTREVNLLCGAALALVILLGVDVARRVYELDEEKTQRQVAAITESESFAQLEKKTQELRKNRKDRRFRDTSVANSAKSEVTPIPQDVELKAEAQADDYFGQLPQKAQPKARQVPLPKKAQQVRNKTTELNTSQVGKLIKTEYFQDLQKRAKELRIQPDLPLARPDMSINEELTNTEEDMDYFSQLHQKTKKLRGRTKEPGK
jgi:hypothetical protein